MLILLLLERAVQVLVIVSKLLTGLGLRCGHENIFNPSTNSRDFAHFDGDASWLVAFFITKLDESVTIFHQARNPVDVAQPFIRLGFFDDKPTIDEIFGVTP